MIESNYKPCFQCRANCNQLAKYVEQPCWGWVEIQCHDINSDELRVHLCEGHKNWVEGGPYEPIDRTG